MKLKFKDITEGHLKEMERLSKSFPCIIQDKDIKLLRDGIIMGFGFDSDEMQRLKKIADRRNKCR